ncbi:MAG TPA: peroxiredoxin [Burkholderiales bacterium]|nr:peroxiredoxin [Burkholderiales bacterium]
MLIWIAAAVLAALALYLWRKNALIAAKAPQAGETAPAFSLPDQNGNLRSLEQFRGKWLVLYFYPRDDTPGCTEQAMRFRNTMRELEALDATVCGVSVDDSASHAAFARKYNLPFALLADRGGDVAAQYGSLRHFGVIRIAKRNTFLVDPDGCVAKVYFGVSAARNADEVKDDLKRRQSHGPATEGT